MEGVDQVVIADADLRNSGTINAYRKKVQKEKRRLVWKQQAAMRKFEKSQEKDTQQRQLRLVAEEKKRAEGKKVAQAAAVADMAKEVEKIAAANEAQKQRMILSGSGDDGGGESKVAGNGAAAGAAGAAGTAGSSGASNESGMCMCEFI